MVDTTDADQLRGGVVETINLYVDLEPGTRADLEAISRASLEFANALRELAFVLDPSLTIRLELVSGTEGSLSLNSILRAFGVQDPTAKLNVKAIALGAMAYFVVHTTDWAFERGLEAVFTSEEKVELSSGQMDEIARKTAEVVERRIAATQVERVYRELQTDPAIRGVGVTREAGARPAQIVPRAEFPERTGLTRQEVESGSKRTRDELVTLRLISPVLEDSRRQWRFRGANGDFSAAMKDARFVDDLVNGRSAVPMVSNIQMDVEMRTVEENKNGVWQVRDRMILHVRQVRSPPLQGSFDLPRPPR